MTHRSAVTLLTYFCHQNSPDPSRPPWIWLVCRLHWDLENLEVDSLNTLNSLLCPSNHPWTMLASMRGWTRLQECFEPRFPSRTSPRASLPSYCFSRYAHTPGHVRRKDSSELHPLLRGPLLVFTCPPRGHNVLADGCIILIKFDISCNASRFHLKSVFICCYLVLTDLK